jgi:hypothetical protein
MLNLSRVTLTGGKVRGQLVHGGAILVRDGGILHLAESAIVDNEAFGPFGNGGGIFFEDKAGGSITDSVITKNRAVHLGGGINLEVSSDSAPAAVSVARTIIVNNEEGQTAGTQDVRAAVGGPVNRSFISGAYNRLGNETTGFSDGVNGDYIKPESLPDYVVTRMADIYNHLDDSVALSLRDAIDSAELATGAQEIWVPAWRLLMTRNGTGAISSGDFDVASAMTIRGIGPGATIINGVDRLGSSDRIFDVAANGVLTVSHATLALGEAPGTGSERSGGAIRVRDGGHLNLDHSSVVGNLSTRSGDGGAIYFAALGSGDISNSVITVNESEDEAGGIFLASSAGAGGVVTLENSIVANNIDAFGSGIDLMAEAGRQFTSNGNNRIGNEAPGFEDGENGDIVGEPDYIVTSLADTHDGSSDPLMMSLRDAIDLANATVGLEKIWLPAWDFILTLARTNQPTDVEPSYGDLDIKDSLEILGVHDSTSVTWLTSAIADEVFELVGDYDLSGEVDLSDNILWQTSDGDDDGADGGQGDYDAYADHFGNTLSLLGVSVA